jgi:hypothetical protein
MAGEKPRACPFCGSEDVGSEWMSGWCYVACNHCMTTGPAVKFTGRESAGAMARTRRLAVLAWTGQLDGSFWELAARD